MTEVVIGSRGSALALAQTRWVADSIQLHNPGIETRIEIIRTKGDKILDTPLAKIGDKGLFVKEIEIALLEGRIDLAVHSMKDLPTDAAPGLLIGAVPPRADPSDVLLSGCGGLFDLPPGSSVGSSSVRRKAQLLHVRPDLSFHDLRGNLDTRIRKLQTGEYDAIVVAYAGLHRLQREGKAGVGLWPYPGTAAGILPGPPEPSRHPEPVEGCNPEEAGERELTWEKLPPGICLPAVGQGALAVQVRENDALTAQLVAPLDDPASRAAVTAERALLAALGGGCQAPIAALAVAQGDRLTLCAMAASLDGKALVRASEEEGIANAEALGEHTAQVLLASGARQILSEVRQESSPTSMGAA